MQVEQLAFRPKSLANRRAFRRAEPATASISSQITRGLQLDPSANVEAARRTRKQAPRCYQRDLQDVGVCIVKLGGWAILRNRLRETAVTLGWVLHPVLKKR
jgi:hypothetical protein